MTCLTRAVSFRDDRPAFRCADSLAERIAPAWIKTLIRLRAVRRFFVSRVAPRGMYEYVVARTKRFDEAFARALSGGFDAIVILGAGFDTRACRLAPAGSPIRVIEIDAPATQAAKRAQFAKRGIAAPPALEYLPIDFNVVSLKDALAGAGLSPRSRYFFLLEGLLMYLEPEAVDSTFAALAGISGPGSEVHFDFVRASVIRGDAGIEGEGEITSTVRAAGEAWRFGIEPESLGTWLESRGFALVEFLDADALAARYLSREKGPAPRVNGTHCIAFGKR
jgi:methyltransferase (TIGR00027 family)